MPDLPRFRKELLAWYHRNKRDLPWRQSLDPYRILVSEFMLQQTRVSVVLPYYEKFLAAFPDVNALALAPEDAVLTAWAGLGYYARARNLHQAARWVRGLGAFPDTTEGLQALPGVGEYTAAAVASIAFGFPEAAVDGNVLRVLSRITAEPGDISASPARIALKQTARRLLDRRRPGDFNQAMMELGATVCLPAEPKCPACPVARHCEARKHGRELEFPISLKKPARTEVRLRLLLIIRDGQILLRKRPEDSRRLAGFWELPLAQDLPDASIGGICGEFRHSIVNTNYHYEVARAEAGEADGGFYWIFTKKLHEIPLSTTARKALACLSKGGGIDLL